MEAAKARCDLANDTERSIHQHNIRQRVWNYCHFFAFYMRVCVSSYSSTACCYCCYVHCTNAAAPFCSLVLIKYPTYGHYSRLFTWGNPILYDFPWSNFLFVLSVRLALLFTCAVGCCLLRMSTSLLCFGDVLVYLIRTNAYPHNDSTCIINGQDRNAAACMSVMRDAKITHYWRFEMVINPNMLIFSFFFALTLPLYVRWSLPLTL